MTYHPELTEELHDMVTGPTFLRDYDPSLKWWKLTTVGENRLARDEIPPNLPTRAKAALVELQHVGVMEEDELADKLSISLSRLQDLLKRLGGYGYVEQTQLTGV